MFHVGGKLYGTEREMDSIVISHGIRGGRDVSSKGPPHASIAAQRDKSGVLRLEICSTHDSQKFQCGYRVPGHLRCKCTTPNSGLDEARFHGYDGGQEYLYAMQEFDRLFELHDVPQFSNSFNLHNDLVSIF